MKRSQNQLGSMKPLPSPSMTCHKRSSFVFIKIHKSGSTTLIAPFQRFAFVNGLNMMVTRYDHNMHLGWPYDFIPSKTIIMPKDGERFEALVNHVVYNRTVMQELIDPKAVYVTIVREPKSHLISSYNYFGINEHERIGKDPKAFRKFLSNPIKYDVLPKWMIPMGNNTHIKSMTRNLQSADLGLDYKFFDSMTAIQSFVSGIDKDFNIILVLERLPESIVLMKRRFCWSMQDIVRVNKNQFKWDWDFQSITKRLANRAYTWNNADTMLYKMANQKLDELLRGQERMKEEVEIYEKVNGQVAAYCGSSISKWNTTLLENPSPLVVEKTEFNEEFTVDRKFCVMLLLKESDFSFLFKCKQYPGHRLCRSKVKDLHHLYALINGEVKV